MSGRMVPKPVSALRVLEVFEPRDGGVPEHVRQLSLGLAGRGVTVTVAGCADAAPRRGLEAAGIRFVALPLVGSVPAPRADAASLRALGALVLRGSFDLVHAHAQKAGLLARPVARALGVPVLYSPHSFVYRSQVLRARRYGELRRRLNLGVERGLGRVTAELIGCARDEWRAAIEDGIVPPERCRVIENAVDLDLAVPVDAELVRFRGAGPLLGFVGAMRDQKGLPTLLDALELLARDGRAPRMAIIGNGPLWAEVEARVRGELLSTSTIVRGFGGRVEPYLGALDAFVLPSYWEGMPIAVLEAMACGLPVVATAVNGTPEAVIDGETGFLVLPRDPSALAQKMVELAGSEDLRVRMGRRAQAVARTRFTTGRLVSEMVAAYQDVIWRHARND
jgi:glycosyltransferase involved in cell wall biosynthesis